MTAVALSEGEVMRFWTITLEWSWYDLIMAQFFCTTSTRTHARSTSRTGQRCSAHAQRHARRADCGRGSQVAQRSSDSNRIIFVDIGECSDLWRSLAQLHVKHLTVRRYVEIPTLIARRGRKLTGVQTAPANGIRRGGFMTLEASKRTWKIPPFHWQRGMELC